jgi:dTDP-4-amino-4,6-dideoxygalactose transaminase
VGIPFIDLSSMHAEVQEALDLTWHEVTRSNAFIGGAYVDRFEDEWARYCGTRYCVGLASGTIALQLALIALGVRQGDEVIVPVNTFFATVEAVLAVGARPVFIDVSPTTLLMTATAVQEAITRRTAAVLVVHLYGQPADMDAIGHVAAGAGIPVVEDAAQAHGATWKGNRVGSLSQVGCFSFYPSKNLGAFGDAGAIVTDDMALAARIRSMSDHGRSSRARYVHEQTGGTHRLDGLQAAILSVKLARLDEWNARRRQVAGWYARLLERLPIDLVRPADGASSSHHLAVIQATGRDEIARALAGRGIASAVHYPVPCHRQPIFREERFPAFPVAERAANRLLSLPMYPHLRETDVQQVATAIAHALAEA